MSALVKRMRTVAIEFAMWRSGRQGEILWVDDLRVEQASAMARQPMRLVLNDPH